MAYSYIQSIGLLGTIYLVNKFYYFFILNYNKIANFIIFG